MTPKHKANRLLLQAFEIKLGTGTIGYLEAKQIAEIAIEFARQEFVNHCCAEIGIDGTVDQHFDTIKQAIDK